MMTIDRTELEEQVQMIEADDPDLTPLTSEQIDVLETHLITIGDDAVYDSLFDMMEHVGGMVR